MASTYFTVVTDSGTRKILEELDKGEKLSITEFAVGDGGGSFYTPEMNAKELKNEVWRGPVNACYISEESENLLIIESAIPSDTGGFTIREMGVFDKDGTLIAICNTPDTQKVKVSDGVVHELDLAMEIALANTDSVELIVDPTVVMATKKDIERLRLEVKTHIEDTCLKKSGGEVKGNLRLDKGYYIHVAKGNTGTTGYAKIATIKIMGSYENFPIMIGLARRGGSANGEHTKLYINFDNSDTTDPELVNFIYTGADARAHLHKTAEGMWDLYIQKSEAYDVIVVTDYSSAYGVVGNTEIAPDIEWKDERAVSSPPTGSVLARLGGRVNKADRLNVTKAIGSPTEPVYIDEDGLPVKCDEYLLPINIISGNANLNQFTGTDKEISHGEVVYATYRFKYGTIKYDSITVINVILASMLSIATDNVMYSILGYKSSISGVDINVMFHNAHSSVDVSIPNDIQVKIYYIDDDNVA